jgi:hypothetical protein
VRAPARALRHHAQINDLLIGRGSFLTFVRSFSDHGTSKLKSPHALINVPLLRRRTMLSAITISADLLTDRICDWMSALRGISALAQVQTYWRQPN